MNNNNDHCYTLNQLVNRYKNSGLSCYYITAMFAFKYVTQGKSEFADITWKDFIKTTGIKPPTYPNRFRLSGMPIGMPGIWETDKIPFYVYICPNRFKHDATNWKITKIRFFAKSIVDAHKRASKLVGAKVA